MASEQGTIKQRTAEEGATGTPGNSSYVTISEAFPLSPGISDESIEFFTGKASPVQSVSIPVTREYLRAFYNQHVCNGVISVDKSDFPEGVSLNYVGNFPEYSSSRVQAQTADGETDQTVAAHGLGPVTNTLNIDSPSTPGLGLPSLHPGAATPSKKPSTTSNNIGTSNPLGPHVMGKGPS